MFCISEKKHYESNFKFLKINLKHPKSVGLYNKMEQTKVIMLLLRRQKNLINHDEFHACSSEFLTEKRFYSV